MVELLQCWVVTPTVSALKVHKLLHIIYTWSARPNTPESVAREALLIKDRRAKIMKNNRLRQNINMEERKPPCDINHKKQSDDKDWR